MTAPITPVRHIQLPESTGPAADKGKPGDFGSALDSAVRQVEQSRNIATEKVQSLLHGKPEELHSVVLATQRAQLEFELFLEVRNKVVQAYQEIMSMQV